MTPARAEEGEPAYASAYAQSLDKLLGSLDARYRTADPATLTPERKTTVFMAGATGFLGSYIVEDLLERKNIEMIMRAEPKTSRPPSRDGRGPSAGTASGRILGQTG
ncbi:L-aminoadipate-semialdehyde dehydrogenase, partial [Metarhizium majus ARSEF 297]